MTRPARAMALIGVAAVLTVLAPFQTGEVIAPLPRFGYWLVLSVAGYAVGFAAHCLAERHVTRRGSAGVAARIALAGALTGLGAFALVYGLNGLALGYWASGRGFAILAVNVFLIAAIISAVFVMVYAWEDAPAAPPDAHTQNNPARSFQPAQPPPLLARLPLEKRGRLVSLSVEDHYVRVRTVEGAQMVLMRLGDAIGEVGDTPGLQVHRSHWVALDQVASARRRGDGAVLAMTHGPEVPVSRANLAKIRAAGLLSR